MLFLPKKSKFKKQRKGKLKFFNRVTNLSTNPYRLRTGSIGLKALSAERLTSKNFEALRLTITKIVKKSGKLIINGFPNVPVSKKPLEVRMGKGKGSIDRWVFKVKPGFILCEILTNNKNIAISALEVVQKKLNIKTKIIFL
jgi:large subunit ribosomal protein L16